ncbi:hypothetical protein GCK72_016574 [Caenorhabditis remanei]|uniref:Uncharacterized protein n=1 Tax=Caenorhabditis remanei TaxID=31234 RepID=A0A6A5G6A1_CAERE|nr:hypothetical protein GCK72_016574 [Caenorhabditis remanei]KAF1750029.1 hypothetical protein GCK72_016574 [Caenorhabditis remanei]
MKFFTVFLLILAMIICSTKARRNYQNIDYKLYDEADEGKNIEKVYEVIEIKPAVKRPHHHHNHHRNMKKVNSLNE